jgi:hypothetical protein
MYLVLSAWGTAGWHHRSKYGRPADIQRDGTVWVVYNGEFTIFPNFRKTLRDGQV